jgi:dipeptidyl aminopeptidase/acylaminoacyl peptidase
MPVLLLLALFLAACSPAVTEPVDPDDALAAGTSSSVMSSIKPIASSSSVRAEPLEQLPAELTIEHFSNMRLSGTGLTLKKVSENADYTHYDADYWSNGLRISGIMKIPKGDGPFPLIMTNHGYIATSVYTRGRGLKREEDYLARHGFAVFHSDYRGHADSDESPDTERRIYDAGLEYSMDVVNAIEAVRGANLSTVDASRVGMLGHSMGGGVSMNIAVSKHTVINALALYAPVNADAWENFWRWRRERDSDDRTALVMKTRDENPEAWDALSSKTYLKNITIPVILFQGSNDKDVPKEWSDELNTELTELGKDVTYVEYAGEAHEFGPKWTDFMQKLTAFFELYLKAETF